MAGLFFAIVVFAICLWPNGSIRQVDSFPLRSDLKPSQRITAHINETNVPEALEMYAEMTGRRWLPGTNSSIANTRLVLNDRLAKLGWARHVADSGAIQYHADGASTALELKQELEALLKKKDMVVVAQGETSFWVLSKSDLEKGR